MAWIALAGPVASAAPIHVNCGSGGNLQNKIDSAPGGATIVAIGTCKGPFHITDKSLTIKGGPTATLDGLVSGSTLHIDADGKTVHLVNLRITNGGGTNQGGGIKLVHGTLTLLRTTVTGNQASVGSSEAEGGGIWANTTTHLTLTSSRVTANSAIATSSVSSSSADGGGIWSGSNVTLTHSVVSGNTAKATSSVGSAQAYGGGVSVQHLTMTGSRISGNVARGSSSADFGGGFGGGAEATSLHMIASKIKGNQAIGQSDPSNAAGDGGGVFMISGDATLVGSGILANRASATGDFAQTIGGGIDMAGELTLQHSSLNANTSVASATGGSANAFGGGASVEHASVILTRSTVGRNIASATAVGTSRADAGGITTEGAVIATNSTIASNQASATSGGSGTSAEATGGGSDSGEVDLVDATVAGNSAIASADIVHTEGGGFTTPTFNTTNSIVSGNAAKTGPDCSATTSTSHGHNLVQHTTGCLSSPNPSDITGKAALIGKLKNNGGRTLTMSLAAASPAVDAVPTAACTIHIDQRGVSRPQGPKCDIGAFERM